MKIVKKLLIACCLGMMMMAAGCGSDEAIPQGKVVKGPVYGAKVFDSTGVQIGVTDTNGNFPLRGVAPYHTTGGFYTPVGSTAIVAAPAMKAPAGVSQITPLSTLFVDSDAATQAAITALLAKAGVTLGSDLSAKTSAAGQQAIVALNEAIGLASQNGANTAQLGALVTAINNDAANTTAFTTTSTITTAATASLPVAAATAATTAVTAVNNAPVGTLPTVPAGTTSGSTGGSTGGTTQN